MITELTTVQELRNIFLQALLNNTDKISKVSKHSVNSAIGFGVAKVGQKALKEVARVEGSLFPDAGFGSQLDYQGENVYGIGSRLSASISSTYVRVVGSVGTSYEQGIHTFSGNDGIVFEITQTTTITDAGYAYVPVRSIQSGLQTKVDALTLSTVIPIPLGHTACINEFAAVGGRDEESDESYRERIKQGANLAAANTLDKLTQLMKLQENNVLKTYHYGYNDQGKVILALSTENGQSYTSTELSELTIAIQDKIALSDLVTEEGSLPGIILVNANVLAVDLDFRVQLSQSSNPDTVRQSIQRSIADYFNPISWNRDKVEWDDLLEIVKRTSNVIFVPDQSFTPNIDLTVPRKTLPRVRQFIMRDLQGNIISDTQGQLSPLLYIS